MSIKVNVHCPVCNERLEYIHDEDEAWGVVSIEDNGIVEITANDRGVVSDHMRAHSADGTRQTAFMNRVQFQADRAWHIGVAPNVPTQ